MRKHFPETSWRLEHFLCVLNIPTSALRTTRFQSAFSIIISFDHHSLCWRWQFPRCVPSSLPRLIRFIFFQNFSSELRFNAISCFFVVFLLLLLFIVHIENKTSSSSHSSMSPTGYMAESLPPCRSNSLFLLYQFHWLLSRASLIIHGTTENFADGTTATATTQLHQKRKESI